MGKICLRICCALALVVFVSASQACAGDGGSRTADMLVQAGGRNVAWMKSLHDTLPVCKVSIPGTHDSGTVKGGPMLKTQSTNIPAQLQQGIRAFDIRLEKKNGKLGVFHSHAFQDIYWEDDVLPAFIGFLQAHPSEVLIVSLKKEGGESQDYASLLSVSLSIPAHQRYFVMDFRPELTVWDCRGKILFLHRDYVMDDYPGAACVGWKDNSTCLLIPSQVEMEKKAVCCLKMNINMNRARMPARKQMSLSATWNGYLPNRFLHVSGASRL